MSKRIILVRHAKSSWDSAELADFDRPLNKRGLHDAPMMGERLRKRGIRPELIVSSPALRAISTARHLAEALSLSTPIIEDARIYEASPDILLRVLRDIDDGVGQALLVGHNPGMTALQNRLSDTPVGSMPTCALAQIELPIERWSEVAGSGHQLLYDIPKNTPQDP